MRITSLHVNGINAAKNNGLLEFVAVEKADIFCFQEIKENETTINSDLLNLDDYTRFMNYSQKKGHHGTACYSKIAPIRVMNGIGEHDADEEGRVITMEFEEFFLVNAYVPNAGKGLARLDYKLKFNKVFLKYCEKLRAQKNLIICGDLNVAHEEIDLAHPKINERNAGFTIEERQSFNEFLAAGYIDTFREFIKDGGYYTWWSQSGDAGYIDTYRDASPFTTSGEGYYTWWVPRSDAKERNIGWRLDYFLINSEFRPALINSEILRDIEVADHCPVRLTIDLQST